MKTCPSIFYFDEKLPPPNTLFLASYADESHQEAFLRNSDGVFLRYEDYSPVDEGYFLRHGFWFWETLNLHDFLMNRVTPNQ